MELFYLTLICILVCSVIGWIRMIIDMKRNPIIKKQYDLSSADINELKDTIENMEGREFEEFCYYIFKKTGHYKNVVLTQEKYDGGKDLILIDNENKVIYVEAKRYTDRATVTEEFQIGREIVTKFAGTMLMDGVKNGIIITTGNIHSNGCEAIRKIEENSDIKIEVFNMNNIVQMVREYCDNSIYNMIEI